MINHCRKVIICGKKALFYDAGTYDFSKALSIASGGTDVDIKLLQLSGLDAIAEIVLDKIHDISSSFYFEYNILGTLLDDVTNNKLTSFLYLKTEDGKNADFGFINRVISDNNPVINYVLENDGYTLFYHPDVFIDASSPMVNFSILGPEVSVSKEDQDLFEQLDKGVHLSEADKLNVNKEDALNNVWRGVVQFDRDYEIMLRKVQSLKQKKLFPPVEKSVQYFHKLLHHRVVPNGTTVYMTIPVLGTPSSNQPAGLSNIQGQGVIFLFFKMKNII